MTGLPDWAPAEVHRGDADWLLIVCTGGHDTALKHPFEPIGIYYDTGPDPLGRQYGEHTEPMRWGYRPRPHYDEDGRLLGVFIMETGTEAPEWGAPGVFEHLAHSMMLTTKTMHTALNQAGSVVATCPSCDREHRIKRLDWFEFLHRARVSVSPWADVSVLD